MMIFLGVLFALLLAPCFWLFFKAMEGTHRNIVLESIVRNQERARKHGTPDLVAYWSKEFDRVSKHGGNYHSPTDAQLEQLMRRRVPRR